MVESNKKLFKDLIFKESRSRRFYMYFLSYLFILFIGLLILGLVVYGSFIRSLQSEVETASISALTQARTMMNTQIRGLERIATNISLNPDLTPFKMLNGGYDAFKSTQELGKYSSGNGFVFDIVLFYDYMDTQKIFTTTMVTSLDIFFGYIYRYDHWDKNTFLQQMRKMYYTLVRPAEDVEVNRALKKDFVTYICPLPVGTIKTHSVAMFIIDGGMLRDQLSSVLGDFSGYAFILDRSDQPIIYTANGNMKIKAPEVLKDLVFQPDKNEIDTVKIGGEEFSAFKITSEYNKWSYLTVIKKDQYLLKVHTSRKIFNLTVLGIFILGILLAFILATRNYKPLKELLEKISGQVRHNDLVDHGDEFAYISEAIRNVALENEGLIIQLKSKADIVKEQLVLRLLRGKRSNVEDMKDMEGNFGLKLEYPFFAVLLAVMDDYESFKTNNDINAQNLIMFSIANVAEELSQEVGWGYSAELVDNRGVALLLNIMPEKADEQYIGEIAYKMQDFFKQHFGFTMTIGIGSIYNDMFMIHTSFQQANRAVYYRLIKGCHQVIFYEEVKENIQKEYKYPAEMENKLIMAIKQGQGEQVETITKEFKDYIRNISMTPEVVQCIGFSIINAVLMCLDETGLDLDECFEGENVSLFSQPFETVDDLGDRIINFCNKVCTYIKQQKVIRNFSLCARIFDIVQKRYNDCMLSLDSIASELYLSSCYVSRYFKDQTGFPLMHYIDMMRMKEVKSLLKNTMLSVKEILNKTGYIDESNFIRKFKKIEGITPMQYRSISRK